MTFFFLFIIAYFIPDVIGEPLTNREIPYIKDFLPGIHIKMVTETTQNPATYRIQFLLITN